MTAIDKSKTLIWIDMEMTGLEPDTDRVIEIATLVTDGDLNIIAEGPVLAVHQSDETLAAMDEWNQRTHGASGLIERVRASKVNEAEAERLTLEFLQTYADSRSSPMCGNSVHQDRRFLVRYMPTLEAFFHYRNLDVSTVKELAKRWRPGVSAGFAKKGSHQALDDIRESVEELKYYREHFFRLD
ncbi:MAG TPA: oligoribonuclease [Pseudohongiella sp.]|nr:oligoribonuclease [Pseudohongiella sp.]